MTMKYFFIIGCARSGTTAIAKLLDTASNASVMVEDEPKLCFEARQLYMNKLKEPLKVLQNKNEQILKTNDKFSIYGDKNPNYLPFIPYMVKYWNPYFIFVVRDGRDVIRSLMDWHQYSRGSIFGMNEDSVDSNITSAEQDWWDYSRLRPNPGKPYYDKWQSISRFEKCCWYWNEFNLLINQNMKLMEKKRYYLINMNRITPDEMEKVFSFLSLKGFNEKNASLILNGNVNSSMDRYKKKSVFPDWREWSPNKIGIFNKYTKQSMALFNYK